MARKMYGIPHFAGIGKMVEGCRTFSAAIATGKRCTPRERPARYLQVAGWPTFAKEKSKQQDAGE